MATGRYRRAVIAELPQLARRYTLRVVCGLTGSGKSRLLQTLSSLGAQVLDLERLAAHRGSVLGNLPDEPQPGQKMFESRIWWRLRSFKTKLPVFVESESKRIGTLQVPDDLMAAMWESECVRVDTGIAARVRLLMEQYPHFVADPAELGRQLDRLVQLHGRVAIERWKALAQQSHWPVLVHELLEHHYDPAYTRSIAAHYPRLARARSVEIASCDEAGFGAAARALIEDAPQAIA